ncbi:MAG: histidine kinase [Gemmatimonadota bacterium]
MASEGRRGNGTGPEDGRDRRIELLLVFGFWTLLAALWTAKLALVPDGPENPAAPRIAHAFGRFYLWALLTPAVFRLARRFPVERGRRAGRVLLHLGAALAVAALAKAWDVALGSALLPEAPEHGGDADPLRALLRLHFFDELIVYLAVLAAGFARDYFVRLQARQAEAVRLEMEAARLRAQLAESRLQALRMQVNPHFLFNTLNAISALVERDPTGVRRMVARLGELLRHALEGSAEQEVTLEEELGFVDRYLEIVQVRFGARLRVRREVDPAVLRACVPNLILQPLVENAVQHGIAPREEGGTIEVRAARSGERLLLSVRDDGPPVDRLPVPGEDGGVGLANTRARLEAMYGGGAALTLRRADGAGLVAELDLPFREG